MASFVATVLKSLDVRAKSSSTQPASLQPPSLPLSSQLPSASFHALGLLPLPVLGGGGVGAQP